MIFDFFFKKKARVGTTNDAGLREITFKAANGQMVEGRFSYSNGAFDGAASDQRFDQSVTNRVQQAIVNGRASIEGAALLDLVFDVYAFERTTIAHTPFSSVTTLAEPSIEVSFDIDVNLLPKSSRVSSASLKEPRLVVLVEFAFNASDLNAPLSTARLPPDFDLQALASDSEGAWRRNLSTADLDLRFVTLAAFGATNTASSRRYTRAIPVPPRATHFRIVSDRVVHRTFDSSKLETVVIQRRNGLPASSGSNLKFDASAISIICPPDELFDSNHPLRNDKASDAYSKKAVLMDVSDWFFVSYSQNMYILYLYRLDILD